MSCWSPTDLPNVMRHHDRGTATIEFALVAPLLISLLLGICDIAPSTMAYYRFGNASQSVADLATQFPRMQTSDMVDVFAGGASVLAPYSSTNLSFRITSIASDGKGNAFVHWSCASGAYGPTTAKTAVTTTATGSSIDKVIYRYNIQYPAPAYSNNGTDTSFITVEAQYIYTAPAGFVMPSPQTMSVVNYMAPRQSTFVGFPWDGVATHSPPTPTAATKIYTTTLSNGATCSYSA